MPKSQTNQKVGQFQSPEWLQSLIGAFQNAPTTLQQTQAGQPMQQGYEQTVTALDPMQQANQTVKQQLDPYQKGVEKALKEGGYAQAQEALSAGIPAPKIVQQAGLNQQQGQISQQPTQQGKTQPSLTGMDLLKGFLPMLNLPQMVKNSMTQQGLQTQAMQQRVSGTEPLQAGEREKISLDAFNKIMQGSEGKPMSAESGKMLANMDSGLRGIDEIESLLAQDPKALNRIYGPGSALGQSLDVLLTDLPDILGRLRSGGAINDEEYKRYIKMVPKKGLSATFQNPKTAKFQLNRLRRLFSDVKKSVAPSDQGLSKGVQSALQAGFSKEEVMARLKEKGFI